MKSNNRITIILGIVALLLMVVFSIWRYSTFNNNLPEFSLMMVVEKVVLLGIVLLAGYLTVRQSDTLAAVKPLFRIMFLIIIIGECTRAIMDYICMFHIFPGFIEAFHENTSRWMQESSNWPEERKEQALGDIFSMRNVQLKVVLQGLMQSIIISSIFAIIFAFIITTLNRKNKQLAAIQKQETN